MSNELSVWKGKPVPDDMLLQFHVALYHGLGCALQELPRKTPSVTHDEQARIEDSSQMLFEMSCTLQQIGLEANEMAPVAGLAFANLFVRFRPMLEQLAQVTQYSPNDLADRRAVRRVKEAIASLRRDLKRGIDATLAGIREKEQKCSQNTIQSSIAGCAIPASNGHMSDDRSCAANVRTGCDEPTTSSGNGSGNMKKRDTP